MNDKNKKYSWLIHYNYIYKYSLSGKYNELEVVDGNGSFIYHTNMKSLDSEELDDIYKYIDKELKPEIYKKYNNICSINAIVDNICKLF